MPRIRPPRTTDEPAALAPSPEPLPTEPVTFDLDPAPTEPVEIDLSPPEPAAQAPEPAPAPTPASTPAPANDDAVRRALEATQRAEDYQRQLADAQRQAAAREQELVRDRDDAQYNSILTAIASEQSALEKAESDYATLSAAGDWANAAKAQRAISIAAARMDRLEDNKSAFEARREELKRAPAAQPEQPKLPDRAQQWLRDHPEFTTDRVKNEQIGAVHRYLTEVKRLPAFSESYFDALDNEFGFKSPPPPEPAPAAPAPAPARRSMPVSAPVSREVPTASGQRRSNTMTLSPEEREIARNSFGSIKGAPDLTNDQKERLYAENKAKLNRMRASGEYRQTTEQTG